MTQITINSISHPTKTQEIDSEALSIVKIIEVLIISFIELSKSLHILVSTNDKRLIITNFSVNYAKHSTFIILTKNIQTK
jgi:hypothetical protein